MAIPLRCEGCGEVLRMEDVREADDIATCRGCGYTGPFVGGQRIPKMSDDDMACPPKGVTLHTSMDGALTLTCRPPRKSFWFLASSSGFIVLSLLVALSGGPKQGLWDHAISITAWLGLAGLAASIVYLALGRLVIRLEPGHLRIHRGVWGLGPSHWMEFGPNVLVSLQTSDHRLNRVPQLEVVVQQGRTSIRFGALDLAPEARKYVAAVLRRAASGG